MTFEDSTVQQIAGLTYYQREDAIHIYRFADFRLETVDAWAQIVVPKNQAAFQSGEHIRSIYDIRQHILSLYAMKVTLQVSRQTPLELRESVAVLAGDNFARRVVENLLRRLEAQIQAQGNRDLWQKWHATRVFTTEGEALEWLADRAASVSPPAGTDKPG